MNTIIIGLLVLAAVGTIAREILVSVRIRAIKDACYHELAESDEECARVREAGTRAVQALMEANLEVAYARLTVDDQISRHLAASTGR